MADAPKKGAKKGEEKPEVYNKRSLYKVEGTKVVRSRRACPKDGPGVFLAEHKDRFSCGRCGYTEFKKRENPPAAKA
jgi:ubiquitin-small subunit ribosomal protein S27Ae